MSPPSLRTIKIPTAGIVVFRPGSWLKPGEIVAFIHTVFKIKTQENVIEYVRFIDKDVEIEVPVGVEVWLKVGDNETKIG